MMDPPEHDRFRALVSRVFTPRAVTSLEPMIREVIRGYLDPLKDATDFDAVADFAAPFPVEVISRMLGVPEGERQQIRHWLDCSLQREPGQIAPSPENEQAVIESGDVLAPAHRREAQQPGRRHAVAPDPGHRRPGRRRGDRPRRHRDHRVRHAPRRRRCGDGHEARRQRRGAVRPPPRTVAEDPRRPGEDPPRGRRDPPVLAAVAVPGAVLRAGAHLEGGTVPAGFPVLLITGAATRDPRAFERADDFDIERPPGIAIGLRSRRAQLPRRRARAAGEPHRDRRARRPLAATRGRRSRPPPRAHVERRGLLERARPRRA